MKHRAIIDLLGTLDGDTLTDSRCYTFYDFAEMFKGGPEKALELGRASQ